MACSNQRGPVANPMRQPVEIVRRVREAVGPNFIIIYRLSMLDLVFSIDSIITAVGMTEHLPIMVIAVVVAVMVMLLASEP